LGFITHHGQKQVAPNIPIHLSTQANVLNVLDAKAYFDMGVNRIIVGQGAGLSP